MRKIYIILITLALSLPALADYHYASHTGSNTFPYTTWETAADSIQKAINATTPGDTAYIGSGHWFECVTAVAATNLRIIGMGTDSTFCHWDSIQADWYIFRLGRGYSVENITFRDMPRDCGIYINVGSISNCSFNKCREAVFFNGGQTSSINHCVFDSCGRGISGYADTIFISNNFIRKFWDFYGIDMTANYVVVNNNIVTGLGNLHNIYASGVFYSGVYNNVVVAGPRADGIIAGGRNCPSVRNNNTVILGRKLPSIAFGLAAQLRDTIYNNIVVNWNWGLVISDGLPGLTANYNDFWRNDFDVVSWSEDYDSIGNIFVDPMYADPDSLDFRLQAYSPLINAGDPNVLDVDGSRSDIGAYGGPHGSSYEYRDLPPHIPDSLSGLIIADTAFIVWHMNTEADFALYHIYRDTISVFEPSEFNMIADAESSLYADASLPPSRNCYYRISALDNQGNVSAYSEELNLTLVGIGDNFGAETPRMTAIESNYPNPFNSSTTIIYSVANLGPIPAQINIDIYDILGRRVKTLINERKEIGIYRIIWDGRDDSGHDCPSGVYFASITQWGVEALAKSRKIVLMR